MNKRMLGALAAMAAMAAAAALTTGCATSRSEVKLSSPGAAMSGSGTGKVVVIRSVKDERVFEQAPHEPSTPSIGLEGTSQATAETKARAIGRKRNTYGQALGDVMLEPGQTVEKVVRENLAAALNQAGFQVKSAESAGANPITLDVRIKKFWAWLNPGFWAVTVSADVATDITASSGGGTNTVSVHAEDKRQVVTDGAWIELIDKALQDYRAQAAAKLSNLK
ncbi:MAG: hypothetical protein ACXWG9_02510 [Usitatibacter sp.]